MKKIDILIDKLRSKEIIIIDGATGTELTRRGVKTTLPLWSASALFTDPEVVKQIHLDYIQSGADIIITNTFRTTERTFLKVGRAGKAKEATRIACLLARQAVKEAKVDGPVFIAGSIAPLEDCYSPLLTPPQEIALREHRQYVRNLKEGGVDFLLVETMITIRETIAALEASKAVNIPVAVSFCCDQFGKLLSGEDIGQAIEKIKSYSPFFIGINCLLSHYVTKIVDKMKSATSLPLCVYAQGEGKPADDEGWVFTPSTGASWYAKEAKKWKEKGFQIIGGCCGTTPEYIKKIRNLLIK